MRCENPDYFEELALQQHPEYLWIGCSDSWVPVSSFTSTASALRPHPGCLPRASKAPSQALLSSPHPRALRCGGCSQVNQIVGLSPGEVLVQRNVGNQANHTDLHGMACLEYAVQVLQVGRMHQGFQ